MLSGSYCAHEGDAGGNDEEIGWIRKIAGYRPETRSSGMVCDLKAGLRGWSLT